MGEIRCTRYDDPKQFYDLCRSFLSEREAENSLMLGILGRLRSDSNSYSVDPPFLSTLTENDIVTAVVVRTPPFNLLISETSYINELDEVIKLIVDQYAELPGVFGPNEVAGYFAQRWSEIKGIKHELAIRQRVFKCNQIKEDFYAAGGMRKAKLGDKATIVAWIKAFEDELDLPPVHQSVEQLVDRFLRLPEEQGAYLWNDDDGAVSLAVCGNPTPNGLRIGPVYTPPAHRKHGYATALVGQLTGRLLRQHRYCYLNTDLANPTSNKIYQAIGYEPVCDVDEYRFVGNGGS
jgi:uncharacterized protein